MEAAARPLDAGVLADCPGMVESEPEHVNGTVSGATFLPTLIAETFDWLVVDFGYEVEQTAPGSGGSQTTRMYSSPKTVIKVYVTLGHGCSANVSLAPAGYPLTAFDPLQRRLEMRGLPPHPNVGEFRRRVQRHDLSPRDYERVVREAVQPYADALRSLAGYEIAGDWGL